MADGAWTRHDCSAWIMATLAIDLGDSRHHAFVQRGRETARVLP
jgi:hypothetical protein